LLGRETEQNVATQIMAVVCAWCNQVVMKAPAGATVSHTICATCTEWTMLHPTSAAGSGRASDLEELQGPSAPVIG
jgi:hypothetical protein